MKKSFVNQLNIRGFVFSHTLQERLAKDGSQKFIFGQVEVATDEKAMNVVPVRFFANEKTKKGTDNATFANLKTIMESDETFEKVGDKALRVRISASVDVNDFYNREGELVSSKSVRGSFLHFLNHSEVIGDAAARFETDMLIQAAIEKESRDGFPYMELKGFVFNYRGDVLPVSLSASTEQGMAFFASQDISASNPYFGKVWGDIKSTVVTVEKEKDDSAVGFGQVFVEPTTRTFRSWEVVGANVNQGMSEDTVTKEELDKGIKEREIRLAELKAKTDERNGSASGSAGFPTAAAVKPAANANDFRF